MRAFIAAVVSATAALAASTAPVAPTCQSQTQPNPIASQYNTSTGVINGTLAILPIPYSQARSLVPSQYPILTKQYQAWLKGTSFPAGMFPAVLQTQLIHDLRYPGGSLPDFSRASISFPFVDRLNDGYTAMMYGGQVTLSEGAAGAIAQFQQYGYNVTNATFTPQCEGYACAGPGCPLTYAAATAPGATSPLISLAFRRQQGPSPYSLDFYKNITNQPQFSTHAQYCENFIRLFNTSVTAAPYGVQPVAGTVVAQAPALPHTTAFANVYGIQAANAWVENNFLACDSLKGYHGTGSGD